MRRHDAVLDRIVKAIPGSLGEVQVDRKATATTSMLRPDIVITNEVTRRVTIVDVTIPFENRYQTMEVARQAMIEKYKPLVDELREKGYTVDLDAIVVGSLGSWDPANERVLRTIKIDRRYAKLMRKLIVSDTI